MMSCRLSCSLAMIKSFRSIAPAKSHSHLSHKVSGYYHVLLPALQVYSLPHESLHHFLLRYNYSSYNYRSDLPRKTAVSEHLLLLLYPVSLIICIYLLH